MTTDNHPDFPHQWGDDHLTSPHENLRRALDGTDEISEYRKKKDRGLLIELPPDDARANAPDGERDSVDGTLVLSSSSLLDVMKTSIASLFLVSFTPAWGFAVAPIMVSRTCLDGPTTSHIIRTHRSSRSRGRRGPGTCQSDVSWRTDDGIFRPATSGTYVSSELVPYKLTESRLRRATAAVPSESLFTSLK